MWAQNLYNVTTIAAGAPDDYDSYAAYGINNSGQVVGEYDYNNGERQCGGFLYSGGVLTILPDGTATAINDAGQFVGYSNCGLFPGGGFLDSGGVSTNIDPSELYVLVNAINASGQAVGTAGATSHAFLYSAGVVTNLGYLPGGGYSGATGINNSGQIVGSSTNASGNTEAFLYSGGVMTGLGILPGYTDSTATAINDKGQVVGYATDSSRNTQAFLYSDGVMTGLGFLPGSSSSSAYAINDKGQIVGNSGPNGGFLYSNGQMYDLNSLLVNSPESVWAAGINDSGQIIGGFSSAAYLLTPVSGRFVAVAPCRVADTRTSGGALGGPALDGISARSFAVPQSACGIPATAQAYSLNVTVVPRGPLPYLTIWPTGMTQPAVSTLNSFEGGVVANAALVAAGQNGAVSVYATGPTDVILDINGYFDPAAGDSFYAVQPCRVEDTRRATGPLGGPALATGETRNVPVPSSPCGLPATAAAYSMNATVVPAGFLGYLTTWPTGEAQPNVSTLNSWTGKVVANAAIVPAGTNGATSVYVTNPTDVILDANGYFAAPGRTAGLTFYAVVPCRVADTREADSGPILAAGTTRSFAIPESGCGIPSSAAAYALNITVVPDGSLGFLTAWPTGSPKPFVSTLNSWDGTVVANAAIVPAGTDGAVSIYVTDQTHVILDINGYFAP
jgi:probable HAF family extracellular repeat protein